MRYRDTLGNLAHSLKTPLAVIRASLGSADSDQRRSEAAIQLEIDRIAQIVEHQVNAPRPAAAQRSARHRCRCWCC